MTQFPELFAALAAPFHDDEVKTLKKGAFTIHYVTARTVMNRLDTVVGPENWWDTYTPTGQDSVLCALTIRLPDGRELTKMDAGGCAGMSDAGDDDKSAYSDALKRAAVKFGCSRYLYRDGTPNYGRPEPARTAEKGPGSPQDRSEKPGRDPERSNGQGRTVSPPDPLPEMAPRGGQQGPRKSWAEFIRDRMDRARMEWKHAMIRGGIDPAMRAHKDTQLPGIPEVTNHFGTHLIGTGAIKIEDVSKTGKPGTRDLVKVREAVADVYRRAPGRFETAVDEYLRRKTDDLRTMLGMDPVSADIDDPEDPAENGREPGCDDDRE